MEIFIYLTGFVVGLAGLVLALKSIFETRNQSAKEFLDRHKKTLQRHKHFPKD